MNTDEKKALEPLGWVLDLESYEYLLETRSYFVEAITYAIAHGATPEQIGQYVSGNTTNGRSLALTCEKAARHIQRNEESRG